MQFQNLDESDGCVVRLGSFRLAFGRQFPWFPVGLQVAALESCEPRREQPEDNDCRKDIDGHLERDQPSSRFGEGRDSVRTSSHEDPHRNSESIDAGEPARPVMSDP